MSTTSNRASNKLHVILCADDTNLCYPDPDSTSLVEAVQSEFVKIHNRFCVNKLSENVKKTTSVLFRSNNKLVDPSIQSIHLCGAKILLSDASKVLAKHLLLERSHALSPH